MKVFYEYLARQNTVAHLFQLQLGFRRRHIWVSVIAVVSQRPLFRTLYVLLGARAHRPCFDLSVFLQSVCLSPDSQSDCLRFFSPPHPPSFVDSLDSELWYRSGCRAAALASSSTEAVGQSFRQLFTTRSALQG